LIINDRLNVSGDGGFTVEARNTWVKYFGGGVQQYRNNRPAASFILCRVSAFCIEGFALDTEGLDASAKGRRIKCRILGFGLPKKAA
jgi:hypothetical protein